MLSLAVASQDVATDDYDNRLDIRFARLPTHAVAFLRVEKSDAVTVAISDAFKGATSHVLKVIT